MPNLKTSLVIFLSLIVFSSCKKDPSETYYFTASVNGVETSFLPAALADTLTQSSLYTILGSQKSTSDMFALIFGNSNRAALTPGTYPGMNNFHLHAGYEKASLNKQYTNLAVSNFTVVITTLNNTYVEGSFNGILKDVLNQTDSITISNGKFKAQFFK